MTCFSIQKSLVLAGLLIAAGVVFPRGAAAQNTDAPVVVELFTTSDCTACIFADRALYDTMNDENVIALSCHIKDLGSIEGRGSEDKYSPADGRRDDKGPMDPCILRQWGYSGASDATLKVPLFVINGEERVAGADIPYYHTIMNSFAATERNKAIRVFMEWKDEDTIRIHLPPAEHERDAVSASVWIVRYKDIAVEKIDQGVNKGRVLRFSNIIQDIRHVAKWRGQTRSIDVDVAPPPGGKDAGGYAVLVSHMMGEPILAAGKLKDYAPVADKAPKAQDSAPAR